MTSLFAPLAFARGPVVKNRFMLGPLTNTQSHDDGTLGEDELRWLARRARGGFGLVTTCAAHVQPLGQGFPGQLGIYSDRHLEGLARLAAAVKAEGGVAMVQLHHAGRRSPAALIGSAPVGASDDPKTGARALTLPEVEEVVEAFAAAAVRAERAGFDGVQVHGAHGYLISQFLDQRTNRRTDRYGGPLENRARLLFDVVAGIRAACSPGFLLGMRLSPERFGMRLGEIIAVASRLLAEGRIDLLDMSLWDFRKEPEEEEFRGRTLLSCFAELERGPARLAAGGKIRSGQDAAECVAAGADLVVIGRAGILHHDFPRRVESDSTFGAVPLPVTPGYLRSEGLADSFVAYMRNWEGFVVEEPGADSAG
ncbi:MAG: NADH:flavin oxidoreductase [Actinobacteria bacterium]|nr:NADH:flavin oxidoreductase [Actinomycetota bacterium]